MDAQAPIFIPCSLLQRQRVNQNTALPCWPRGQWPTFLNIRFLNNATTKRPARHLCLFPPNNRTPEQLHRVILDSKLFLLIEGQRGKNPSSIETA